MEDRDEILIYQGAEARCLKGVFVDRHAFIKERFSKKYRHPKIDKRLICQRLIAEARNVARCRKHGVNVASLLFVDPLTTRIYFEWIEGLALKAYVNSIPSPSRETSQEIGAAVGRLVQRMHGIDVIHGDLTSANFMLGSSSLHPKKGEGVVFNEADLYVIDLGLSYVSTSAEDKAVDLYVLTRAIKCTHPNMPFLADQIIEGYKNGGATSAKSVIQRFGEVCKRGRKREMEGYGD